MGPLRTCLRLGTSASDLSGHLSEERLQPNEGRKCDSDNVCVCLYLVTNKLLAAVLCIIRLLGFTNLASYGSFVTEHPRDKV